MEKPNRIFRRFPFSKKKKSNNHYYKDSTEEGYKGKGAQFLEILRQIGKEAEKLRLETQKDDKNNGGGDDDNNDGGDDGDNNGGGDDGNNGSGGGKNKKQDGSDGNGNGNKDKGEGSSGGSGSMKRKQMKPMFGCKFGYHAGNENWCPVGQLQCVKRVKC